MGEAYLMKRGGANTSVATSGYAMICAKIPAGSACVCAKGGERMTAESVPGIVSFPVPSSGAWTVTISDGARGRTGLVTISGHGEVRAIQISYPGAPSVSEGGVILSAQSGLKGGYTLGGNAIVSGNAIRENGAGGFWLAPAIDLSSYSTLTVTGYLRSAGEDRSRIGIASTSAKLFDAAEVPDMAAVWMGGIDALYTASLSITNLTGSYYIGSASVGNNLEITGITLS